jgi:hypothetical protein
MSITELPEKLRITLWCTAVGAAIGVAYTEFEVVRHGLAGFAWRTQKNPCQPILPACESAAAITYDFRDVESGWLSGHGLRQAAHPTEFTA